jgi:hypothetical protein
MLYWASEVLTRVRCRVADWMISEYRAADPSIDDVFEGPNRFGEDSAQGKLPRQCDEL